MMSSMIDAAITERKRILTEREQLYRVNGGGQDTPYEPGEKWRNNKQYLTNDQVKDGNGKAYIALKPSIKKPPANNPEFWKTDESEVVLVWSNDPVGFLYQPNDLRRNNSKIWKALETHTKTPSNGPKQGNVLWTIA